jgi:CO/xanthine dehydrogenase FAD-binding subunit
VKPSKFEYHAPRALDEALEIFCRYAGEARVLAGGQSLVPMLNLRLLAPRALVDLNRVAELAYIEPGDGMLRFGAMTRQRKIEFSGLVREKLPILQDALRWVGHLPTRARGTIGGSIAHADPSAELPMILAALQGQVVVKSPRGERCIPVDELFQMFFTTSLASDEILTEVHIPVLPAGAGYAIEEFARRHGDFAVVAAAAVISRDGARCTRARIATGGTGPAPRRLRPAEEILERDGLDEAAIEVAASKAAELIEPTADAHGSADFRRHLTRVLVARAVRKAAGNTKTGKST